ncbi:MAG TPA: N-acetyl sugar amidotransferase [Syntrophus sp. (in: bacteria)]|jgi:N-acetyl sugar amidotransferase|nr:N-acetyl sugar amidotransferase [Syntrophus sp. (in: bacteria)]
MPSQKILDRQLPILPSEIKFCKKCVVSNQRPRIHFDEEGICGACRYAEIKERGISWPDREKELRDLCDRYRRDDGRFDVIIPASGGKDSSRVAWELKALYGMHPLTITWAPFEYTPEGYENFRQFIKVGGFNNLMAWQNGRFHRKLARVAFEALGDAWQPFTYGQVAYAFHIARAFDVKLVFFGENGEAEYSGDPRVYNLRGMPFDLWAEQYFKGITVDDLVQYGMEETDYFSRKDFDPSDLTFYRPPDPEDMKKRGIEFHWFSYYKKWIPQENYYHASEHTGFQANPHGRSEGTYSKYASLDDQTDGFHFYLAFIKFGIGRCTSDAAHEVRDGHITREEGAALVRRFDGEFPRRWYKEFLEYLDITDEHFWEVADRFRRPHIWKREQGTWNLRAAVHDEYPASEPLPGYLASLEGGTAPR